jgi:8-oxo-dGTP pyrophosphatase MutT (NUDIX family)
MSVTPLPASTVILLRDGTRSPEVLLLERHARSEFLPDMYVFPGGRVDEDDLALGERAAGLTRERACAALPSVAAELALGFFVAAVRETFEESGVLLARKAGDGRLVEPARAAELCRQRLEVQAGEVSFRELVLAEELELATDLLAVHAHWITPETVARRFDTVFFSALAPAGQLAAHDGVESTAHVWIRPEDALEEAEKGTRQMIFPTSCNLETLCGFARAEDALAASHARPVVPVLPRVEVEDGRRFLVIPAEAGYGPRREMARREPV